MRVDVDRVHWRKDMDTLHEVPCAALALNDIGRVTLTAHRVLFLDPYESHRETGSFILIDSITNGTVAAGMVIAQPPTRGQGQDLAAALRDASEGKPGKARSQVRAGERRQRFGASPGVLLFGGSSGVAPLELAYAVERRFFDSGASGVVLSARPLASRIATARAVAEAGLLAIVPVDSAQLDEAAVMAELEGSSVLVVGTILWLHSTRAPLPFSRRSGSAVGSTDGIRRGNGEARRW